VAQTSLSYARAIAKDLQSHAPLVKSLLATPTPGDRRVVGVWYPGLLHQGVAVPPTYYELKKWQAQRAGASSVWLSLPVGPKDTDYNSRHDAEAALAADANPDAKPEVKVKPEVKDEDEEVEDAYEAEARALCEKLGLTEEEIDDDEIREAIIELGEDDATALKDLIRGHDPQTLGLAAYALAQDRDEVNDLFVMADWVRSRHGTQEYGELEAERDELRDELEKAKARIAELEALLPSAEIIPLKQDAE
jgi:hypothetical protein